MHAHNFATSASEGFDFSPSVNSGNGSLLHLNERGC
jgi:hypothetical protein